MKASASRIAFAWGSGPPKRSRPDLSIDGTTRQRTKGRYPAPSVGLPQSYLSELRSVARSRKRLVGAHSDLDRHHENRQGD
jgi:hypothetical protein